MAVAKGKVDKYANVLQTEVTMSAANTLTFEEIDIGASLFDRVGLLLHRIEYIPSSGSWNELQTDADQMWFGLCSSNQFSALSANERSVIDYARIRRLVATNGSVLLGDPVIHSFEGLPEYGVLTAPRPLFLAMHSSGFAGVGAVVARIYFTIIQLADADYFELLETRRYFG